jgi:hypothetical protein
MEVVDKTVEAALIPGKILTFCCLHCHQHLLLSLVLVHIVLHPQKHQETQHNCIFFQQECFNLYYFCYNLAALMFLFLGRTC